jgi:DNA-binding transcriptional MerR regulator
MRLPETSVLVSDLLLRKLRNGFELLGPGLGPKLGPEMVKVMAAASESTEYYSITDLTREFGVSTRTIRFYEDEALIKPVRRGRTRLFRPSDRRLLAMILRGKRLGFSIADIREILNMYREPPGEEGQLRLLLRRVKEKRVELEQKRRDIEETLNELELVDEQVLGRLAEIGVPR